MHKIQQIYGRFIQRLHANYTYKHVLVRQFVVLNYIHIAQAVGLEANKICFFVMQTLCTKRASHHCTSMFVYARCVRNVGVGGMTLLLPGPYSGCTGVRHLFNI